MKGFARLAFVVLTAAIVSVSCKKDENTGRLSFDTPAAYISEPGEIATVGFSAYHVKSFYISNKPSGWVDPELDVTGRTMTIIAPAASDVDADESGSIVLVGKSYEGASVSATIFVTVAKTVDMSENASRVANSYIASKKDTHYTFDATLKGDGTSRIAPESLKIIWQTSSSLVQYLDLNDGKASFYIGNDGKTESAIKPGNALVGAYDQGGKLLWSYHVWVADYDPAADALEYANGYKVMSRNMGALKNVNSTTDEVLDSHGLYYQWGRKEPLVGPKTYQASSGSDALMYDGANKRVLMTVKASEASIGTLDYAVQNPLIFITAEKDADWAWQGSDAGRWSATAKTLYDPCPYGWRVAPAAAFEGLTIKEDLSAGYADYEGKYGWTLRSGAVESLYIGAGRRIYPNGTIRNNFDESLLVRNAMEMQPWVGYYWTSNAQAAGLSRTFTFWFKKDEVSASGLRNDLDMGRANGMSVRCVKVS